MTDQCAAPAGWRGRKKSDSEPSLVKSVTAARSSAWASRRGTHPSACRIASLMKRHRLRQGNDNTIARSNIGVAVCGPYRAGEPKRFEPSSNVRWSRRLYAGTLRRFYVERYQRTRYQRGTASRAAERATGDGRAVLCSLLMLGQPAAERRPRRAILATAIVMARLKDRVDDFERHGARPRPGAACRRSGASACWRRASIAPHASANVPDGHSNDSAATPKA